MQKPIKESRQAPIKMVTLIGKGTLKIEFPFDWETLNKIRSLPTKKWHAQQKYWAAPFSLKTIKLLEKWNFFISPEIIKMYKKEKEFQTEIINKKNINIPGLKGKLYPYQEQGVLFIEKNRGRALIADEMGLGKTIQSLAWLQLHPERYPVIIVMPASLKYNWKNEAEKWMTNPDIQVLSGKTVTEIKSKIILINYDILSSWLEALLKINPQVLICDECHKIKNSSTKRTKAIKKLAKEIPNIICLSGTPIINRPIEFYNAINLINKTLIPNFIYFTRRYCDAKYNGFGWDYSGASHKEELHEILTDSIMIRRLKKDVLSELPEKTFSFIPMELNNKKEYHFAENDFIQYIKETKGIKAARKVSGAEVLTQIETLKQVAVKGKMKQCIDWIKDFLESGEKLVIFAVHKFVIDKLMEKFGAIAVKIDGSIPVKSRAYIVDKFQTDKNIKLFIGNIQAAGVGITLTAASNLVFLELPWTPGELNQASDRVHRIGQKNIVNIHLLLAKNTIEEKIAKLIDEKRKILDSILDGTITEEKSMISELMNSYYEKNC